MATEYRLSYTANEIESKLGKIDNLAEKNEIPTKTSELINDSGYITSAPVTSVNGKTGAVILSASDVGADASGAAGSAVSSHNTNTSAHADIREQISQLSSEKVDKTNIFLGIASDGLMHIFVDGNPVGSGVARGGGDDVFGYVDENNVVVLSGNLPTGAYTIKYEMTDGSLVDIGSLALDDNIYYTIQNNLTNCTTNNNTLQIIEGESYSATITANSGYELKSVSVTMGGSAVSVTNGVINIASVTGNIVITAVAEVYAPSYTNILTSGEYTVKINKRWSASSKAYSACNGMITIDIPVNDVSGKTIYFKGFTPNLKASNSAPIWYGLNSANEKVAWLTGTDNNSAGNVWTSTYLQEDNGVYSVPINSTTFGSTFGSVTHLLLNMAVNTGTAITTLPNTLIMTIDEPIYTNGGGNNVTTPVNQIPISINADGTPFVGTNGEKGYKTGTRLSGSSGEEKEQSDCCTSGFIPVEPSQMIRIKNLGLHDTEGYNLIIIYDSNKQRILQQAITNSTVIHNENGVYYTTPNGWTNGSSAKYFRFCCAKIDDTTIATVDQEIA